MKQFPSASKEECPHQEPYLPARQHSSTPVPNLQNCEKIAVHCLSPPSLWYFVMVAPGDEDSYPNCGLNALGTNPNLFLFFNSPYPLNSNILLAQDLLQNLSGIHLLLFTCKFPAMSLPCLLHWSPYLHSFSLPSIPYTTSRVVFIEYQTEHVTCLFQTLQHLPLYLDKL